MPRNVCGVTILRKLGRTRSISSKYEESALLSSSRPKMTSSVKRSRWIDRPLSPSMKRNSAVSVYALRSWNRVLRTSWGRLKLSRTYRSRREKPERSSAANWSRPLMMSGSSNSSPRRRQKPSSSSSFSCSRSIHSCREMSAPSTAPSAPHVELLREAALLERGVRKVPERLDLRLDHRQARVDPKLVAQQSGGLGVEVDVLVGLGDERAHEHPPVVGQIELGLDRNLDGNFEEGTGGAPGENRETERADESHGTHRGSASGNASGTGRRALRVPVLAFFALVGLAEQLVVLPDVLAAGFELEGVLVGVERLLEPAGPLVGDGEIVERLVVVGIEDGRALPAVDRLLPQAPGRRPPPRSGSPGRIAPRRRKRPRARALPRRPRGKTTRTRLPV